MKNIGLGKNTPIKLQLSRTNYEALVDRHGQWVRWMMADKCPCTLRSGRPDMNCQYCGGDGTRYSFQKTKRVVMEKGVFDGDSLVELSCPPGACLSVDRIAGASRDFTPGDIYNGNLVKIVGDKPERWDELTVTYEMTEEKEELAPARYLGGNVFQVDVGVEVADIGSVPADITKVIYLRNVTTGEEYYNLTARRNFIYVSGYSVFIEDGNEIEALVKYLPPRKFLLLSQTANRVEQQWLDQVGGDASLSFPNEYNISEGDVVTAMVGNTVQKQVMTRSGNEFDRIPEWYVADIVKIETLTGVLQKGVDYVLHDRNRIRWLQPVIPAGQQYSLTFMYHQTYKVLKEFPNTRSSENQLLPRRVAVKLMTMSGNANEGL